MKINLYTSSDRDEWNDFVSHAKNSHFMFHRDYMEYHADRFSDFSLMARNDKEEVIGIMYTKKIRRVYVNFYPHPSFTRFARGRQMQANEIVEIAMDIPQVVSIM